MKIIFFTCATGPYDGFIQDIRGMVPDGLECYYLHDEHLKSEATEDKGWKYINLDTVEGCPKHYGLKQRFGRLLSHRHFSDADMTIYFDNKWILNSIFFTTIFEYAKNSPFDCVVPRHPEQRSLIEELMFAFKRGTWGYEETLGIANKIKKYGLSSNKFISTLTLFLLRKNTPQVNRANEKWYWYLKNTYEKEVRDQPFFPYSGMPFTLVDDIMHSMCVDFGCEFRYEPTGRRLPEKLTKQLDIKKGGKLLTELNLLFIPVAANVNSI